MTESNDISNTHAAGSAASGMSNTAKSGSNNNVGALPKLLAALESGVALLNILRPNLQGNKIAYEAVGDVYTYICAEGVRAIKAVLAYEQNGIALPVIPTPDSPIPTWPTEVEQVTVNYPKEIWQVVEPWVQIILDGLEPTKVSTITLKTWLNMCIGKFQPSHEVDKG